MRQAKNVSFQAYTIFWYLVTKNIEKQALNIHYQNTIEIVIPLTMTMIPLWHIFISYFIKQLENSASVSQTPAITKKDLRKCLALLSQKKSNNRKQSLPPLSQKSGSPFHVPPNFQLHILNSYDIKTKTDTKLYKRNQS